MTDNVYSISREHATEIRELLEDTIEYFCDQNMVSGELAWLVAETVATAKLEQIKGNIK